MFNSLQDKLDKALQNLQGRGKITEINVAETVKEIRRALVDADVNYKVAKDLTKRVQDKALGENVFFHQNNCSVPLKKGNKVSFEKERSAKGFSAINIQLVK